MRNPRPLLFFAAGLIPVCLFPVFSSDPQPNKDALAAENVSVDEDPLNPYVNGKVDSAAKPPSAKPRSPAKRKPMKAPKTIPGKAAATGGE